jgi:hypothetical protein
VKTVELIRAYYGGRKILHATSTGEIEVSIPKGKNEYVEIVAYVEKYINEHGFTIRTMDKEPGFFYFLIVKGD